MGRSGDLARGDLMVKRSRADAQGATAAPGEVVSSPLSWRGLSGGARGPGRDAKGAEVTKGRGSRGQ